MVQTDSLSNEDLLSQWIRMEIWMAEGGQGLCSKFLYSSVWFPVFPTIVST